MISIYLFCHAAKDKRSAGMQRELYRSDKESFRNSRLSKQTAVFFYSHQQKETFLFPNCRKSIKQIIPLKMLIK